METLEVENEQRNYYEDVYEEKLEFDIDITVKGGMVIKAHKKILQSQNEMFSKQLSSNPNLKTIELTDFDGIAVQTFIDCLCTGKLTKVQGSYHTTIVVSGILLFMGSSHKYLPIRVEEKNKQSQCSWLAGWIISWDLTSTGMLENEVFNINGENNFLLASSVPNRI